MIRCLLLAATAASMSVQVSYKTPDGRIFAERDMESSASGFVYRSDGFGPATLLHLNSPEVRKTFESINQGYGGVGPVKTDLSLIGDFAERNQKGEKGFENFNAFQTALQKNHNNNKDSGFYNNAAGEKKSHHDTGSHHGSFIGASKKSQGEKFNDGISHKKGHKTTGFHKVYHKDEYKKEHVFYDEVDHKGLAEKNGQGETSFVAENGAFHKGGYEDSAYKLGEQGKKGSFEKGSSGEEENGFRGEKGGSSHFSEEGESAAKGEFHKKFGLY